MKSKIILLIPHFNNLKGLHESLASISNQEPVDVLIVDDGSQNNKKPVQTELTDRYPDINNIICLNNDENRGIEHVLNDGLRYAQQHSYDYIARLDCGDTCYPERFKLQKEFLDSHPDYYLVGSWVSFVDMEGNEIFQFKPGIDYKKIKKKFYSSNQFAHPSVMFRVKAINIVGLYPTNKKAAEDYAYFFKFVQKFKTANLPKILLKYEINPNGISQSKRKQQILSRIQIIIENFNFSTYASLGLMKNCLLYILPNRLILLLKKSKY